MSNKRMPTKYWRFAYDEESLKNILNSDTLPFPEAQLRPSAQGLSETEIRSALRPGCFILLANFNTFEKVGTVRSVGRITSVDECGIKVSWRRVIPSWSLAPHKIAAEQWGREAVFCFNAKPVKEFKLDSRIQKLFPDQ